MAYQTSVLFPSIDSVFPDITSIFSGEKIQLSARNDVFVVAGDIGVNVSGGDGNDTIIGGDRSNTIEGDAGNDSLRGGASDDTIIGGAGDDTVFGGAGTDRLEGGEGTDTFDASAAEGPLSISLDVEFSTVPLAPGFESPVPFSPIPTQNGRSFSPPNVADFISADGTVDLEGFNAAFAEAFEAGDALIDFENIIGTPFDDALSGNVEDNLIEGRDGNDSLSLTPGNDTLDGGAGFNSLAISGTFELDTDFRLNLAEEGPQATLGDSSVILRNIDSVRGASGDDELIGDDGDNIFNGDLGDDTLSGGAGRDTLIGNAGQEVLTGGEDEDTFYFAGLASPSMLPPPPSGAFPPIENTITDFTLGEDVIDLSGTFESIADVATAATQVGSNVLIDLAVLPAGEGDTLTVNNVQLDDLLSTDNLLVGASPYPPPGPMA